MNLGDSGGPLICDIDGFPTVVGITSWGIGCGAKGLPGVFSGVHAAMSWIDKKISKLHYIFGQIFKFSGMKNGISILSDN